MALKTIERPAGACVRRADVDISIEIAERIVSEIRAVLDEALDNFRAHDVDPAGCVIRPGEPTRQEVSTARSPRRAHGLARARHRRGAGVNCLPAVIREAQGAPGRAGDAVAGPPDHEGKEFCIPQGAS